MLELLLVIIPLSVSTGWWAHIIYAGRGERRYRKVDAARQYWKKLYHGAIAQRNSGRVELIKLMRENKELKKRCASGKCSV